jgi:hypothetical protein
VHTFPWRLAIVCANRSPTVLRAPHVMPAFAYAFKEACTQGGLGIQVYLQTFAVLTSLRVCALRIMICMLDWHGASGRLHL